MYKWPHGRVIRIICLILILMMAADLGYNGAFSRFYVAHDNPTAKDHLQQMILGGVFAAIALGVVIAGLVLVGFQKRAVEFLIDVEHEMEVVEWPKPGPLFRQTLIIAITMAVLSLLIFGVDFANHWVLFDLLFNPGGKS
jgi:preprotein translocase SecE subunit